MREKYSVLLRVNLFLPRLVQSRRRLHLNHEPDNAVERGRGSLEDNMGRIEGILDF